MKMQILLGKASVNLLIGLLIGVVPAVADEPPQPDTIDADRRDDGQGGEADEARPASRVARALPR
ncbi:MAG: hypothetical protein JSV80_11795 [Acidobacteriota bacterium]|nr:MAG: hypothetical protein JSV80_11795 [Acidobacteriota bacterium]